MFACRVPDWVRSPPLTSRDEERRLRTEHLTICRTTMVKDSMSGQWIPMLRLPRNVSGTMLELSERQKLHSPSSTTHHPSTAPATSRIPRPPPIKKAVHIPFSHRHVTKNDSNTAAAALPPIVAAHKCGSKCKECSTVAAMLSDFDVRLARINSGPTRAASFKKQQSANQRKASAIVLSEPSTDVASSLVALFANVSLPNLYSTFMQISGNAKTIDVTQFQLLLETCVDALPLSTQSIQALFQLLKEAQTPLNGIAVGGRIKFSEFFALAANCVAPKEIRESVAYFLHCFDPTSGGRLPDLIFNAHFVDKFAKSHIQKALLPRWQALCSTLAKHQVDGDLGIHMYSNNGIIFTAEATALIFSKEDLCLSFLGLED
jgi:hypothetical protein